MGYRSDVAMFIACKTEEDAIRFWELLPKPKEPEALRFLNEELVRNGRAFTFRAESIKWYGFQTDGAIQAAFEFAKTVQDEHGIDTCGGFARIGEEFSDIEYEGWDFEDLEGEPYWTDVINVYTSLDVEFERIGAPVGSVHG